MVQRVGDDGGVHVPSTVPSLEAFRAQLDLAAFGVLSKAARAIAAGEPLGDLEEVDRAMLRFRVTEAELAKAAVLVGPVLDHESSQADLGKAEQVLAAARKAAVRARAGLEAKEDAFEKEVAPLRKKLEAAQERFQQATLEERRVIGELDTAETAVSRASGLVDGYRQPANAARFQIVQMLAPNVQQAAEHAMAALRTRVREIEEREHRPRLKAVQESIERNEASLTEPALQASRDRAKDIADVRATLTAQKDEVARLERLIADDGLEQIRAEMESIQRTVLAAV